MAGMIAPMLWAFLAVFAITFFVLGVVIVSLADASRIYRREQDRLNKMRWKE
jgi:hypothetical protein